MGTDLEYQVTLEDPTTGLLADFAQMDSFYAVLYSDAQRRIAGRFSVSIDPTDSHILIARYSADQPEYLGLNRLVLRTIVQGASAAYDAPCVEFVALTEDVGTTTVAVDTILIELTAISQDYFDQILAACIDATERADVAAAGATAAAALATEKAGLADDAATLANTKAGLADDAATLANTKAGLADDAAALATEKAGLAQDAADLANTKAALANDAATLANTKAGLANDAAALANTKAGLAQDAATLANTKAGLADDAATLANTKAGYADDMGDYAKEQGDYAKDQIDAAKGDFDSLDARMQHIDEVSVTLDETTDPADAEYQDEYQRVLQVLYQAEVDAQTVIRDTEVAQTQAREAAVQATDKGDYAAASAQLAQEKAALANTAAYNAEVIMNQARGNYPTLSDRLNAIDADKQDKILDLDEIRAGAEAGAAAAPASSISAVGYSGDYDDLRNKPELARVATTGSYEDLVDEPTKLSDFTNDLAITVDANDNPASLLSI